MFPGNRILQPAGDEGGILDREALLPDPELSEANSLPGRAPMEGQGTYPASVTSQLQRPAWYFPSVQEIEVELAVKRPGLVHILAVPLCLLFL